jgi:hypothetical protein
VEHAAEKQNRYWDETVHGTALIAVERMKNAMFTELHFAILRSREVVSRHALLHLYDQKMADM